MYKLLGRETELRILLEAIRGVFTQNQIRYVRITGDPGTGKTRLVQALYEQLSQLYDPKRTEERHGYWPPLFSPGVSPEVIKPSFSDGKRPALPYLWWALRCPEGNQHQAESFTPYTDGLTQLELHLLDRRKAFLMSRLAGTAIRQALVGAAASIPVVGNIVGAADAAASALELDAERRDINKQSVRGAMSVDELQLESEKLEDKIIAELARLYNPANKAHKPVPVVIIIDDAQWIDQRSLSFTNRLLLWATANMHPLLVLTTARGNEIAALGELDEDNPNRPPASVLSLERRLRRHINEQAAEVIELDSELAPEAAGELVAEVLPQASADARREILNRASGHPFFLVNYAKYIEECGWLGEDGALKCTKDDLDRVPCSSKQISQLIDERLGLLGKTLRDVLRWGSVQGTRFVDELVLRTAEEFDCKKATVKVALATLRDVHHLVGNTPPPPDAPRRYDFQHRLVYERILAQLPDEVREVVDEVLGDLLREYLEMQQLESWNAEELLPAMEFLAGFAKDKSRHSRQREKWEVTAIRAASKAMEMLIARQNFIAAEPYTEHLLVVLDWDEERIRQEASWFSRELLPWLKFTAESGIWKGREQLAGQLEIATKYAPRDRSTAELMWRIGEVHRERKEYTTAIEYYSKALGIAEEIQDKLQEANALSCLALVNSCIENYDEAINKYKKSIALYETIDESRERVNTLNNLGIMHSLKGEYIEARDIWEQCEVLYRKQQDHRGLAIVRLNLALLSEKASEYEKGIIETKQALDILQAIGDYGNTANATSFLGVLLYRQSKYKEALTYFIQASNQFEALEFDGGRALATMNIADTYKALGQVDQALAYYRQCLPLLEQHKEAYYAGLSANNMGLIHEGQGEHEQSLEYYIQAQQLFQEGKKERDQAIATMNIANTYKALGQVDEALEYYLQCLPVLQQDGENYSAGWIANEVGLLLERRGEHEKALEYLEEARQLYQAVAAEWNEAIVTKNLAGTYMALGQLDQALTLYGQCLKVFQRVEDKRVAAQVLDNMSVVFKEQNRLADARQTWRKAAELYCECGLEEDAVKIEQWLSELPEE